MPEVPELKVSEPHGARVPGVVSPIVGRVEARRHASVHRSNLVALEEATNADNRALAQYVANVIVRQALEWTALSKVTCSIRVADMLSVDGAPVTAERTEGGTLAS